MRRPPGVVILALFVAWQSFGLFSVAIAFAGPHSDLPLQPLPLIIGIAGAASGVVLVRQLWRMRPAAVGWLVAWAVLVLGFALFWPASSSPGPRRRGAMVAVALGAFGGAIAVVAAGRYVRRVTGSKS